MTRDFQDRFRALLGLQDVALTDAELSRTVARYPRCRGKERWEVREYARPTAAGAREYRVVRGSRLEDVYCSVERGRATAVVAALNQLELQGVAGGGLRAGHTPFDFPPTAD